MRRLLIVGGGITGLAAAWQAEQDPRDIEIVLVEKEQRLGGKILSERSENGFLFEGGPESFLSRKSIAIELCRSIGIDGRLIGPLPQPQRSFVSHERVLYPVPQGFTGLIPGDTTAILQSELLTADAKSRFIREPTIPPNAHRTDESVATFMTRRFGSEVFDRLIEPLASGIYAGNPALLSMAATFPHLQAQEREHGSLLPVNGAERKPSNASSYPPFVSFPDGMEELVNGIVSALSRTIIRTTSRVVSIQRRFGTGGDRYTVELSDDEFLDADAVVLAVPAHVASTLTAGIDAIAAESLSRITSASTVVVHLAFSAEDAAHAVQGHGYVVPSAEADTFLACTWSSSKWAHRAPVGSVLLRLYAGRYGNDAALKMSDAELVRRARGELAATLGITAEPRGVRIFRWEKAIPQYNLGHVERVARIRERERHMPGAFLAGAAFDGVGIPDCIASGENAARRAVEYLR